jgi:hypothetical protein
MKIKVVKFIVTPIYVVMDEEGLVQAEGEGMPFPFYPGSPFNIQKTIEDAEMIIMKHLEKNQQQTLFESATELTTQ